MTPFNETDNFDAAVNEYDTTDPVQGGANGAANNPLKSLVNRSRWLFNEIGTNVRATLGVSLLAYVQGLAPKLSPTFTGVPKAPTPAVGDSSTALATTQALMAARGAAAVPVAGAATVTLAATQYGATVLLFTGALTADITAIFPNLAGMWLVNNQTAHAITCKTAAGGGGGVLAGTTATVWGDGANIALLTPQQVTNNVTETVANPFQPPVGALNGSGPGWWWWDPNTGYTRVWVSLARAVNNEGGFTVQLPIVMDHAQVAIPAADNSGGSNAGATTMQKWTLTNSALTVFANDNQGNSTAFATGVDFIVEGYTAAHPAANPAYVGN